MKPNLKINIFYGPNIYAPFPAVSAEFNTPFLEKISSSIVESFWNEVDGSSLNDSDSKLSNLTFAELAAQIAIRIQYPKNADSYKNDVKLVLSPEKTQILLRFIDPEVTATVIRLALTLAEGLFQFSRGASSFFKSSVDLIQKFRHNSGLSSWQHEIIIALSQEARSQSIPVYPVAKNSQVWQFGQGKAGVHYYASGNHNDSFTGMRLQNDKSMSNSLIKRLGFPGVKHALARNIEEAKRIAQNLGYPVVVKPPSSATGNGVSAFVINAEDLIIAFNKAKQFASSAVIIEEHIMGNDHRLAIFGGKLCWVVGRFPANITGDGHRTISELISLENERRKDDPQAIKDGLKKISLTNDVVAHLRKQSFTIDSVPMDGQNVTLLDVANMHKGGNALDLTDLVHPDNIEMAESIARGFRMDTMGIDFITPDISVSWKDINCAIIEVNGTPGTFFDHRIRMIINARFPNNSDGRIASVLLVSPPSGYSVDVCKKLLDQYSYIGYTNKTYSTIDGKLRCKKNEPLHERVAAILADPLCDGIVIETTTSDLLLDGMPIDWVDLILTFENMPENLKNLLSENSGKLVDCYSKPNQNISSLININRNI